MKSRVLIIVSLIVALLAALTMTARSQYSVSAAIHRHDDVCKQDSTLIADETNLTYLKTGAKLVTYSESVFTKVSLKFGDQFKSIHIYYKNDRYGGYKEYVIYLSTQLADQIKGWAKTNL